MKDDIKIKNAELTLNGLRLGQVEASKKLSDIYKKIELQKEEIKKGMEIVEKLRAGVGIVRIRREQEEQRIQQLREQNKREIIKHLGNVKELELEKKERIKKLEGLNFRIMNAEKRENELKKECEKRKIDIEQIKEELKIKNQLIKKIEKLREMNNKLMERNAILEGKYNVMMKDLNIQVKETDKKTKEILEEANQSEYRLSNFNTEYARKKQDLEIYIKRVQIKYEKAFPHLKMKLK